MLELEYSHDGFWTKLRRHARSAGAGLVERALQLHYAALSPGTPTWARGVAYGALAYFIFPVDAVPDWIPAAGFTDDIGVIAAALTTIALQITPEIRVRAKRNAGRWFGPK